jgi:hypothetical protein
METTLVVRGRYDGRTFHPDEPMPDAVGPAELVITPVETVRRISVVEAIGKAPVQRTLEDIEAQLREDREEWGDL